MDDPVHTILADGQSQPFIDLHGIEGAKDDPIGILLLFKDIDGGHIRREADHIDRLGQVIVDLNPWAVNEDVELEGSHL
jgi:hypothetical protein